MEGTCSASASMGTIRPVQLTGCSSIQTAPSAAVAVSAQAEWSAPGAFITYPSEATWTSIR